MPNVNGCEHSSTTVSCETCAHHARSCSPIPTPPGGDVWHTGTAARASPMHTCLRRSSWLAAGACELSELGDDRAKPREPNLADTEGNGGSTTTTTLAPTMCNASGAADTISRPHFVAHSGAQCEVLGDDGHGRGIRPCHGKSCRETQGSQPQLVVPAEGACMDVHALYVRASCSYQNRDNFHRYEKHKVPPFLSRITA